MRSTLGRPAASAQRAFMLFHATNNNKCPATANIATVVANKEYVCRPVYAECADFSEHSTKAVQLSFVIRNEFRSHC